MSDRHVRRSGDDYAHALLALLPKGYAWTRDPASVLVKLVKGIAGYWGVVDGRAADLLEIETDPRKTVEMLPDWERAWGLPEECFPGGSTMEERRMTLLLKMTLLGGQSREFFYYVASLFHYDITIKEYSPFMVGISQAGDTRDANGQYRWEIGPPEMRYCWSIHAGTEALFWFRAALGEAGVDPHLTIQKSGYVECIFELWKPAHTVIVFDYSQIDNSDYMEHLYD
jgi:uncharacterized protein YmfQ (DUF2313 family)